MDGETIGNIDQVLTGHQGDIATHIIVRLTTDAVKRKMIPTQWVTTFEEDEIQVGVEKPVIERLRDYQMS
jgi:uncharacterized protein YrrD